MMNDALLEYYLTNSAPDSELVRIFCIDARQCDAETANRYFILFSQAAKAGSAFAMCACSRFCRVGWGCLKSDEEAFVWAKRAAKSEFPPGHFELGLCYEAGIGIEKSIEHACRQYEIASDGGYGFAAYHLAKIHRSGALGVVDMLKVLILIERSSNLGESMAALEVAKWFEDGDGIDKDDIKAALWYERASELGNIFASLRLSHAYSSGDLGLSRNGKLAAEYQSIASSQLLTVEQKLGMSRPTGNRPPR